MSDRALDSVRKILACPLGTRPALSSFGEHIKDIIFEKVAKQAFDNLSKEEQVAVRLRFGKNLCAWYLKELDMVTFFSIPKKVKQKNYRETTNE